MKSSSTYGIVSVYVRKEHMPALDEMKQYAKTQGVSLNELIWKCIESSWSTLKNKKSSTTKA